MRGTSRLLLFAGTIVFVFAIVAFIQAGTVGIPSAQASSQFQAQPTDEPQDHSGFPALAGPFATGQDVTAACTSCHIVSAADVMDTIHWTWTLQDPVSGEQVGRLNIITSYDFNPLSNEPLYTSKHIGYGWQDKSFDFSDAKNIDCLICHDQTGTYRKLPGQAGHPAYEETEWEGEVFPAVDLALAAQSVAKPSRANCGSCHFDSGIRDMTVQADLDSSFIEPERSQDVHMSVDGAAFTCTSCHETERHHIAGSAYSTDIEERLECASCHGEQPHPDAVLNQHANTVACQTCHIPSFGRSQASQMSQDWSTAGQLEDGAAFITQDQNGNVTYDSRRGEMSWAVDVTPQYVWYNGQTDTITLGEEIDPTQVVLINQLQGSSRDRNARIYPVKIFEAVQPYDSVNNTLVIPALFPGGAGGSNAYWSSWDWNRAIEAGMSYAGLEYSGEFAFVQTEMVWPITHGVVPVENALQCTACHSADGRLDFAALGFSGEEVTRLSNFPPGQPQQPTTQATQPATAVPTEVAPTEQPRPTFAPPPDTLGEVTLNVRAGLTPFQWFLVGLGVVVLIGMVVILLLRRRR